jgi:microcystin-dependent protein
VAQPYVGEIRIFAGNFAPSGWAFCDGSLLPISENETLFQLIGTTYGGDGESTFALPDLRGRLPVHQGTSPASGGSYVVGQMGGVESVTLTTAQLPVHTHALLAADATGDQISPAGNLPAQSFNVRPYLNDPPDGNMHAGAITAVGGSQPHENLHPYLGLSFILSLFGIFPNPT